MPEPIVPPNTATTLPPFSLDVLPGEFKTSPIFKDFKTWEGVFKSHEEAVKKIGVPADQLLRLNPDGTLPPEGYTRLGKPEKYTFPADIKNAPAFSDARRTELAEYANTNNLTAKQFEALVRTEDNYSVKTGTAQAEAQKQERVLAETALKTALGEAYAQNINLAKDALKTMEHPELWDKFDKLGLTTDPALIGFLAEIGKLSSDDDIVNGEGGAASFKLSPNQAGATIRSKQSDAKFMKAYNTATDPAHADAVAEMKRLFEAAYPG